ncbi:MAG TPA: ABC transporter permease [Bacteriovoracaceae bacterium]|nr:ABC transporter permease [Bacteriovoracaceae bacterium]
MATSKYSYHFWFAWKCIQRNIGRNFFIGFSVSLAVISAVWVVAFFDGFNRQIEDAVVQTNTGHFQIQDPLYSQAADASKPLSFTAMNVENLPALGVSPELVLDANILTPEGAASLIVLGIRPQMHKKVVPLDQNIYAGAFLREDDQAGVMIGKELARIFKFTVGDNLTLNYQDKDGELRSENLSIRGIFHYSSLGFEKRYIYISQRTWQQLFLNQTSEETLFNRIVLKTHGLAPEPSIRARFKDSPVVVKTWKEVNPEISMVVEFQNSLTNFFLLIIGLTVTMTILTPVRMLWQERFKEIKMMRVIGIPNKSVWLIGMFEALLMVLTAGVTSSLLLVLIVGSQAYNGIDFRFLNKGVAVERAGIKLPEVVYPRLTLDQLGLTFLFVLVVLGLSYLWSIRQTLKELKQEAQ